MDDVLLRRPGGDEQQRNTAQLRPRSNATNELEPTESGHHHVGHDDVGNGLGEPLQGLMTRGGAHHVEARLAEAARHQRIDHGVVVDHQHGTDAGRRMGRFD